jgi:triacylglycerol lipase
MTARSSTRRRTRAALLAAAAAGASLALTVPVSAPAGAAETDRYADPALPAPATHDPVLFVHGFTRNSSDFDIYKQRYIRNGWRADRLFTIDYDTLLTPNAVTATQIAAKVDEIRAQTGAAKVDIVAHSMGSYSTRHYLKFLGGAAEVDAWVSISGPNHGTTLAQTSLCLALPPCAEMVPGSPFLTALNEGDETPGDVRYFTAWTAGDDLVQPATSTVLAGAHNWQNEQVQTHMEMLWDEETIVHTRNFVR